MNGEIAPCLFIKHIGNEFIIIAIYVDDINIFGTPELTTMTIANLKAKFKTKDIVGQNYCLGIHIKILLRGIFIHQSTYTQKVLAQFNMDKSYSVTTPIYLRSLDPANDIFHKKNIQNYLLSPKNHNYLYHRRINVPCKPNEARHCIHSKSFGKILFSTDHSPLE